VLARESEARHNFNPNNPALSKFFIENQSSPKADEVVGQYRFLLKGKSE